MTLGIGIHPGINRLDYFAIDAINISTLVNFERSAAHAREQMLHPRKPTEAMDFGTALHCAILEPERFKRDFAVAPKVDRRRKADKEIWVMFEATHTREEILEDGDMRAITRMAASVWARPISSAILSSGHSEVAVVWRDEETGLMCKGLIDHIGQFDGWTWIVDLKSTLDATPRGFSRAVKSMHYGAKAAWYFDGCNTVAPRERRFAWIACENMPPYPAAEYEATPEALEAGRSKYKRWLRLYADAKASGVWDAYPLELQQFTEQETEFR